MISEDLILEKGFKKYKSGYVGWDCYYKHKEDLSGYHFYLTYQRCRRYSNEVKMVNSRWINKEEMTGSVLDRFLEMREAEYCFSGKINTEEELDFILKLID